MTATQINTLTTLDAALLEQITAVSGETLITAFKQLSRRIRSAEDRVENYAGSSLTELNARTAAVADVRVQRDAVEAELLRRLAA